MAGIIANIAAGITKDILDRAEQLFIERSTAQEECRILRIDYANQVPLKSFLNALSVRECTGAKDLRTGGKTGRGQYRQAMLPERAVIDGAQVGWLYACNNEYVGAKSWFNFFSFGWESQQESGDPAWYLWRIYSWT